jgi:hypothetical protein
MHHFTLKTVNLLRAKIGTPIKPRLERLTVTRADPVINVELGGKPQRSSGLQIRRLLQPREQNALRAFNATAFTIVIMSIQIKPQSSRY